MELTNKQVYLLELLGFKKKLKSSVDGSDITDNQFYYKKFSNGDHLSICLKDKSCGGSFGGRNWEQVEIECCKIRYILREEGLIE